MEKGSLVISRESQKLPEVFRFCTTSFTNGLNGWNLLRLVVIFIITLLFNFLKRNVYLIHLAEPISPRCS